ncbi:MAG: hypothetical protein NT023_11660, partial [Armatimonadetes bacterium]|nr:hypothetical protein [Armatimonadota bacterium]
VLAKREGFPLSLAELPKHNVSDADNAATYIRRLSEIEERKPLSKEDRLLIHDELQSSRPLTSKQISRAKALFAHRQDILSNIEKAVASRYFVVPMPMVKGTNLPDLDPPNPLFSGMRSAQRWINAETATLLADGKYKEAVESQTKVLHLARIIRQAPSLSVLMSGIILEQISVSRAKKILLVAGGKPEIAQKVAEALQREGGSPSFDTALRSELAMRMTVVDAMGKKAARQLNTTAFVPTDIQKEMKRYGYPDDPKQALERYVNANETNLILKYIELKSIMASPYYQKLSHGFPPQKEIDRLSQEPDMGFAYSALSPYAFFRSSLVSNEADREIFLMGARVLAWKVKRGAFPNSLKEVVSSIPLDPFDGKPLHYRKEGAGFVVYSVGENRKYDGRVLEKGRGRESIFRYPAPPQKP